MVLRAALVTGASRGIGRAIALELARDGYAVGVNYARNRTAADEVVGGIRSSGGEAVALQADLSVARDCHSLFEAFLASFGRIDLLVNNAGVAPRVRADLLDVSEESYDEILATNLKGAFLLTQRVARWMVEIRASDRERPLSIVNVSSVSEYAPSVNRAEYCIAKAGLGMLTKLFAARLAEHEIRVNAVRPGLIRTDMTKGVTQKYSELIARGMTPIRRWGTPEDVARAVRSLASDDFAYSTATVLDVDGGFHMRIL